MKDAFENIESLIEIFGSAIRVGILILFFKNPESKFFQGEIARKLGERTTACEYELKKLTKAKLLKSERTKYKTYYYLNENFPFYNELRAMINKYNFYPELTKFIRTSHYTREP